MAAKIKKTGTIHDTVTGYDFSVDNPLHRKAAIRAKCMECQCEQNAEVRNCTITDCTLWPWRMGAPSRLPALRKTKTTRKTAYKLT